MRLLFAHTGGFLTRRHPNWETGFTADVASSMSLADENVRQALDSGLENWRVDSLACQGCQILGELNRRLPVQKVQMQDVKTKRPDMPQP
jgi:hypothetical protein